jgi:hypothetical protein
MPMNHAILQLDLVDNCRRVTTVNHIRDIDLPWIKSRRFSRESCSSDLSLVSLNNKVDTMPVM